MFEGPEFDLEVVGIVQELDQVDSDSENLEPIYLSNGFYSEYGDRVASLPGVVARFRPGVTDREFERALTEVIGPQTLEDFTYSSTSFDALDATATTVSNGLLIFAGVAAVAGLVAIAQAVVRQSAAAAADGRVIAALGGTRGVRALDPLVPLVPVAVGGSLFALAAAWIASPIMPVGSPRDMEVSRGFDFDGVVLVAGGAALALFVLGVGWLAAATVGRVRRGTPRSRVTTRLPVTVPAGLGMRWALARGRARNAIPVRSAVAGVALGVAGIVAVATFAVGLDRLTHEEALRRLGMGRRHQR